MFTRQNLMAAVIGSIVTLALFSGLAFAFTVGDDSSPDDTCNSLSRNLIAPLLAGDTMDDILVRDLRILRTYYPEGGPYTIHDVRSAYRVCMP